MRLLLLAAGALLALAPPVFGSTQARAKACTVNLLNTSGRTLHLKKASSRPAWTPGYRPQPAPSVDDHALIYWETQSGRRGCWSRAVYRSGRRFVVLTVDGRTGHTRSARCANSGFRRCEILSRRLRPDVFLSVRVT
jgi:hypothetical protein